MAASVKIMGNKVLVVNVYAPKINSEREALFELILHHIRGYSGPILMVEDFNCTVIPLLDCSFVTPAGRHDSIALRRHLDQAQMIGDHEDMMDRAEDER